MQLPNSRIVDLEVNGVDGRVIAQAIGSAQSRLGPAINLIFESGAIVHITMRADMATEKHTVYGNVQGGVVGSGSVEVEGDQVFGDMWKAAPDNVKDLTRLKKELSALREALVAKAKSGSDYETVAQVAKAIDAAESGNGPAVLRYLKAAGKWAFEVANDIGAAVAAAALQKTIGL